MRAARLFPNATTLEVIDLTTPVPTNDSVRVAVLGAGICHSDLHVLDGQFEHLVRRPVTPGHEIAGVVDAVGPDVQGLDIGTPVAVMVGWGCGRCQWCLTGYEQLCPQGLEAGSTADGGFAEYVLVPHARHVVPLGNISAVEGTPFGCAALCAYAAVQRVLPWLTAGSAVTVVGAGGLGQYAVHYLRSLSDAIVIAVDQRQSALTRAAEAGAHRCVLSHEQVAAEILDYTAGEGCRAVIDFVGSDQTLALAAQTTGTRGVIALLGLSGGHLSYGFESLAPEVTLTTVVAGTLSDLHEVVRLAQTHRLTMPLTTYSLEDINHAIDDLRSGTISGRAVVLPQLAARTVKS